jgi:hypothetical protein
MKRIQPFLAALGVLYLFLIPLQSANSLKLTALSTKGLISDPVPIEKTALPLPDDEQAICLEELQPCAAELCEQPILSTVPEKDEKENLVKSVIRENILPAVRVNKVYSIARTEPSISENEQAITTEPVTALVKAIGYLPEKYEAEIAAEQQDEQLLPTTAKESEIIVNSSAVTDETLSETTTVVAFSKTILQDNKFTNPANIHSETGADSYSYFSLFERADQVKKYAAKNGYNIRYAFLADMGMKSGKKRFFLVDLQTFQILKSGLVAHGKGNEEFATDKKYSNEIGSKCTSLGIYKIGQSFSGEYGTAFKLYGLSYSNNNAFKRAIVLHAMNGIPEEELNIPIAQTEGCPSLSPGFLKAVAPIIEKNTKPILLWLFDSTTEQLLSLK